MSKTTKIIAALGVVAGLGVAALPAFTFAEEVDGDVQVVVEVSPAIAMKIEGNNDSGTTSYSDTYAAVPASEITPGSTDVSSYYTFDNENNVYVRAIGTAVEGTTYYQKTAAPTYGVAKSAAPSGVTTLDGQNLVSEGYTISNSPALAANTSSSRISILPNSAIEGDRSSVDPAPTNNFGSTITVYTNNASGYTLSVKDVDDDTRLVHTTGNFSIPTGAEAVAAGAAKWNFDSTTVTSSYEDKTAQAMPAASGQAVTIDQTNTKTTNGSITIVDYNVATAGDQATGVYTDTIVYTATTN